jgi:hypothetical protein
MENVWQFVRDNWLSNRIFAGDDSPVLHPLGVPTQGSRTTAILLIYLSESAHLVTQSRYHPGNVG